MGLPATALLALFVFVNVHGALLALVHHARSDARAVATRDVVGDDLGDGLRGDEVFDAIRCGDELTGSLADESDDPSDRGEDGEPEEESLPPPASELDEDDVKQFASVDWLTIAALDPSVASFHGDELAHDHMHLDDLERPPRA